MVERRRRRLLQKLLSGSKNIRFAEAVACAGAFAFRLTRINGSHHIYVHFMSMRCSSANTLRIQRLEFDREKLPKGPDVIRHACRQRWRAIPPSGTNRAVAFALAQRQWPP